MTGPSIELQTVDETNIGRVEALLEANDLPTQDVRAKPESFVLATAGAEPVGCGGVEKYGPDGLEGRARTTGVETLYLLTTTAGAFFRRRGYEECRRETVPNAIQETTEFAELCPSTATCLQKRLGE